MLGEYLSEGEEEDVDMDFFSQVMTSWGAFSSACDREYY
jgi:hypothetical protein